MDNRPTPTLKVPAGEFQRHIGRYQDLALTQIAALEANRAPDASKAFDHERG